MVNFSNLKQQIKQINFDQIRIEEDDYFEAVLTHNCLNDLKTNLECFFGKSVNSAAEVSDQARSAIDNLGGVRTGQTLYFLGVNSCYAFAMLWPWQDKQHITLKMGVKQAKAA